MTELPQSSPSTAQVAPARAVVGGHEPSGGHGFGTAPVFLAAISTILGAILFLRFGYAVGNVGMLGAFAIIFLGHAVTIPATLAVSEIATNRRVEGGGVYFIISRSFGLNIGGAIGISLYLSQAISVAFYVIAFAESFRPLAPWLESTTGLSFDPRFVSIPATVLFAVVVLMRGADIGVKALWVVVSVLGAALALFFLGHPLSEMDSSGVSLTATVADPDRFMLVFAIVFPAFTGMTAGVGLSGDLANPRRSIPLGSIGATVVGMVIYLAVVLKLAFSASPETLAGDQLVMSRIALWGPVIPIGLACATLSSAIGSILVAPRTLQALAKDRCLPSARANALLGRGHGAANEPRNATLVTAALALVVVLAGSVDFVARIISMFFMVTYGALCAISFLEEFASRPSYRPSFRSKWWLSLAGALVCLFLMFQMDPLFAFLALVAMFGIYKLIQFGKAERVDDLGAIFQGVMTQLTRYLQVRLQSGHSQDRGEQWRPSLIMVGQRTFERTAPLQFLSWLCYRYGVGTYLHFIPGHTSRESTIESRKAYAKLLPLARSRGRLYVDTLVSPSMRTALAQSLQVPGVSGVENNATMFEFSMHDDDSVLEEVVDGCRMAWAVGIDTLVLRHGDHFFGTRSKVHVWLTWNDLRNANAMILFSYILLGHPDWHHAELEVYAAFPKEQVEAEKRKLVEMTESGRLPIHARNLKCIGTDGSVDFDSLVAERSADADLVIRGFTETKLSDRGPTFFRRHPELRDVLFVSARQPLDIA